MGQTQLIYLVLVVVSSHEKKLWEIISREFLSLKLKFGKVVFKGSI
jgi:hypothetical protein